MLRNLALWIADETKRLNISEKRLAEKLGVSGQTLGNIRLGDTEVISKKLAKSIADYLGCSADDVFEWAYSQEHQPNPLKKTANTPISTYPPLLENRYLPEVAAALKHATACLNHLEGDDSSGNSGDRAVARTAGGGR